MEPAPTGGPSAAPDVPPGTPYGHEGAAEGSDERAVGDQTDRALHETPMAPQDTVTPDPLPIVANGVPMMGDSKGSASFARTGYPDESTFAPRAPLSQNGPFSSDGPFSPLGPFSDNPAPGD